VWGERDELAVDEITCVRTWIRGRRPEGVAFDVDREPGQLGEAVGEGLDRFGESGGSTQLGQCLAESEEIAGECRGMAPDPQNRLLFPSPR